VDEVVTTTTADDNSDLAKMLGSLIETERKRLGLTQEYVAERMDVSQNAVTGWERAVGDGALKVPLLLKLEQLFRLPRGTIFQRLGIMPEVPEFEAVVLANMRLTGEQKDALVRLYRVMAGE
jgi:transcriptional regulator with XRE-family HTH domain